MRIKLPSGSYVPLFETCGASSGEICEVPAPPKPQLDTTLPRRDIRAALSALAILAIALGAFFMFRHPAGPAVAPPIASIAVLPFLDMSPAKDQEYLCDGLSEELINALTAVSNLKVAARTSSFRYKDKPGDVRRIGAELGVEHILEGSIRSSGNRLRITAQLIRVNDGYHIWSREFNREFTEIFAVQEELARAVATSVGAELGTEVIIARSDNVEAIVCTSKAVSIGVNSSVHPR